MPRLSLSVSLLVLLATLISMHGAVVSTENISLNDTGPILLPFVKQYREISKRDVSELGTYQDDYAGIIHITSLGVGTPAFPINVLVDTGSADTWICSLKYGCSIQYLCMGECYDPIDSQTYDLVTPGGFHDSYLDGLQVEGDWIRESIYLGTSLGSSITDFRLGLVNKLNKKGRYGVLGLGLEPDGSSTSQSNIVDVMYAQGKISDRVFALWSDGFEIDATHSALGALIFGGRDSTKYSGKLKYRRMIKDADDKYSQYTINWHSFSYKDPGGLVAQITSAGKFPVPVILDSGSTLSYIPAAIFKKLYARFTSSPINIASAPNLLGIPCNVSGHVTLGFGVTTDKDFASIDIPVEALVFPFDGTNCVFGFQPQKVGAPSVLGESFLRYAYVEFDRGALCIGMAQSVHTYAG